jgi:hypothetical protein
LNALTELLGGDQAAAQGVAALLDTGPLTIFTTQFLNEEKKWAEHETPSDGIVTGDNTPPK